MQTNKFLSGVVIFLSGLLSLSGQNLKTYPPPQAPYVPAIPEKAAWTLSVQYPQLARAEKTPQASPRAGEISQVQVTKTGKIMRENVTFRNGGVQECWYTQDVYLFPDSNTKKIGICPIDHLTFSEDVLASPLAWNGFAGVSWLKSEYYDKVVTFEKTPCYHYIYKGKTLEAWINAVTGLPVAYRDAKATYVYTFTAAPASTLTLPAAYQQAWDVFEKREAHRRQLESGQ